jgi:hypothetical protein
MYTEGVPTSVPWSRYAPSHKDRRTRQPYQIRVYKPSVRAYKAPSSGQTPAAI